MSIAFLFPGQGAQYPGMLHALPGPQAILRTIAEVSATLQRDVLELDTPDELRSTVAVELALLTSGVAMARALEEEGVKPLAVAGLSVGAFSAAVAAGVLDLRDAVLLVKLRGERMSQLYPRGYGMAAIVGLNETQVSDLIRQEPGKGPVYVSGVNAPSQIVIAGSNAGVDYVVESARRNGARKAERLDVAVPSHCPLLQPLAEALEERLRTIHLRQPKSVYIANATGRSLRDAGAIVQDLAQNIAHPVRWYDSATVLEELGCRLFLEMPPGYTLTKLSRDTFADVRALTLAETSLGGALQIACRYQDRTESRAFGSTR